jgi:hypothetical protein
MIFILVFLLLLFCSSGSDVPSAGKEEIERIERRAFSQAAGVYLDSSRRPSPHLHKTVIVSIFEVENTEESFESLLKNFLCYMQAFSFKIVLFIVDLNGMYIHLPYAIYDITVPKP